MRIVVRRSGALGDVLETTPIIARLRADNPDAEIDVATHYETVFRDDNNVNSTKPYGEYERAIDLDGTFEKLLRKVHPIDAYSEAAFGDRKTPHKILFNFNPLGKEVRKLVGTNFVVLHACRNWPIRTLPVDWWQELIHTLNARDYTVVLTGTLQDHESLVGVLDLRAKLRLDEQAALIDAARCFVCSESGPMILAQATSTPVIAMLTMAAPFSPVHETASTLDVVMANVPCAGCSEFLPEPTTYFDCKHDPASKEFRSCVQSFSVQGIADLVDQRRKHD
jgi:ADP-heptose:LPS heptosyltransferase